MSIQILRKDAELLLKKFDWAIFKRTVKTDLVLDIGCGDSDAIVTRIHLANIILPQVRIIAVDKSEEKIQALRNEHPHMRITYEVLDIEGDITNFQQKYPSGFKKVFSFYSFNTIQDIPKALKNIFELLTGDGEFYMACVVNCPIYAMCMSLSENEKYKDYMQDVSNYYTPLSSAQHPQRELIAALENAGFHVKRTKCFYDRRFKLNNINELKGLIADSAQVFVDRMPDETRETFLGEATKAIAPNPRSYFLSKAERPVDYSYDLIIARAKKLSQLALDHLQVRKFSPKGTSGYYYAAHSEPAALGAVGGPSTSGEQLPKDSDDRPWRSPPSEAPVGHGSKLAPEDDEQIRGRGAKWLVTSTIDSSIISAETDKEKPGQTSEEASSASEEKPGQTSEEASSASEEKPSPTSEEASLASEGKPCPEEKEEEKEAEPPSAKASPTMHKKARSP